MPAMRVRYDLGIGKATILIADGVEVGVVQRFAGPVPRRERGGKLGAGCGMVSIEQAGAVIGERARRLAYSKVSRAEHFILPHRQAAGELANTLSAGERGD